MDACSPFLLHGFKHNILHHSNTPILATKKGYSKKTKQKQWNQVAFPGFVHGVIIRGRLALAMAFVSPATLGTRQSRADLPGRLLR
jgi:hypothetical protein